MYILLMYILFMCMATQADNKITKKWVLFQVGHVQKVSLVPGKVHEMKTLSLKPLLFGNDLYLLVLEFRCG